jgi:hypothetical protein
MKIVRFLKLIRRGVDANCKIASVARDDEHTCVTIDLNIGTIVCKIQNNEKRIISVITSSAIKDIDCKTFNAGDVIFLLTSIIKKHNYLHCNNKSKREEK